MYAKKALYKKKIAVKNFAPKRDPHVVIKDVKGADNGGKRVVLVKRSPRFYPSVSNQRRIRTKKLRKSPGEVKLRSSITPGTVLILLTGRHKGKRVVFLKQLSSGLLLVTGPFRLNGVPLRRVNQVFVIATTTKVDVSGVKVPDRLDDNYFKRKREPRSRQQSSGDIFTDASKLYQVSDQRKEDQHAVDEQVVKSISKVPNLRGYLRSTFSLQKGQYPHELVF